MIKKVIFDIDNTLIPWKKEYFNEIYNVLKDLQIKCTTEDFKNITKALEEYEKEHLKFKKDVMLNFINNYTGKTYPKEFMDNIIEKWSNCVPETLPDETIKMLEYVKNKYEVVILTDWYKEQQVKRLEKTKILKYFSEVYCAENTKRKPYKEAFMQAIGTYKPEQCIMIGEDFERDIEGALKAGLQAIYYNPKSEEKTPIISYYSINDNTEKIKYYTISKLEEITEIL